MTLTQLEYIVAVAETRSFFRAAERCHVTQPTLSQQIKKFEDVLGVVVFDRSRKPVDLTPAGETLIAQARRILDEANQMRRFVDQNAISALSGDVRLAIIPTLAPFLLPRLVRSLQKNYPDLKLHIEELQTETIADRLLKGDLDFGIMATPLGESRLDERPVFYEPIYLYFSPHHTIADKKIIRAGDLNRNEVYLLADGHCFRDQALELCRDRRARRESTNGHFDFAGGSLQTLKEMVDAVGGYTLLPWFACHEYLSSRDRDRIRPFYPPAPVREVSVVSRAHELNTKSMAAMVAALRESLPKELIDAPNSKQNVLPIHLRRQS